VAVGGMVLRVAEVAELGVDGQAAGEREGRETCQHGEGQALRVVVGA
jgi:hypothetical protein